MNLVLAGRGCLRVQKLKYLNALCWNSRDQVESDGQDREYVKDVLMVEKKLEGIEVTKTKNLLRLLSRRPNRMVP